MFTFRVSPIGLKMRYYQDSYCLSKGLMLDYTRKELEGCDISLIHGGVIVGHLDAETFLNELFK